MKKLVLLVVCVLLLTTQCKKSNDPTPVLVGLQEHIVLPQETDAAIQSSTEAHYAYVNTEKILKNKLLVFIGGTGSKPRFYLLFSQAAAALGYHVINMNYLNATTTQVCKDQADAACFTKFREEIIFGGNQSQLVDVNLSNSIANRMLKLLQHLHNENPVENWDQFYTGSDLAYAKFVVAGHSQGGGHAAYLALKFSVDRLIVFSSPNDYSDFYSRPATWCSEAFATPVNRLYGLMHRRDEIISPTKQYAIWQDMKMLEAADTASADKLTYTNFLALYTDFEPNQNAGPFGLKHNVPVIDNALPSGANGDHLKEVWNYLLGN